MNIQEQANKYLKIRHESRLIDEGLFGSEVPAALGGGSLSVNKKIGGGINNGKSAMYNRGQIARQYKMNKLQKKLAAYQANPRKGTMF